MQEHKKNLAQVTLETDIARLLAAKKHAEDKLTDKMLSETEKQTLKAIWHGL